ncbi:dicer-2 protein [Syncephalastrum racemosum]|uniref:Dicer-2 protein n=1 Tax=Syncephalastrum racemosum TaxID=13706 RepID=A0A1X2HAF5_SYNRA|nr:dicer-2 protein [Syncephalastrum racemosum]
MVVLNFLDGPDDPNAEPSINDNKDSNDEDAEFLLAQKSMNQVDEEKLSRYLDPAFLEVVPDNEAKIADQYMQEEELNLLESEEGMLMEDVDEAPQGPIMLEPREYQHELFRRARDENVIAVLDTGSGKTLIAVMLLKHIAYKEREERLQRRHTKLSFFLVDRVPLVFQQASVIRSNCDVVVEHMCGQMGVDNWSEKKWRLVFEESDVCVMTAQIFLDTLRHGFIHMNEVNLIIFDECHHATKHHPYNLIMHEFYFHCKPEERPKIFGMTASPMNSKTSIHYSAPKLEQNLDSRIYTASNLNDLTMAVNKPREVSIEYHTWPSQDQTPLTKQVREKLGAIERYERCFIVINNVLQTMGSWCADRLWQHMLQQMDQRVRLDTQELDKHELMEEDRALREAHEQAQLVQLDNEPNPNSFSPKVIKLLQILNVYSGVEDFCGIIFVERRHTALALDLLISSMDKYKDKLKCGTLIGHGSRDEGDVQMRYNEQNRAILDFQKGDINLLIATTVAEEGLDIQPCNVVIRFDFPLTPIGYIQSRGRARRKGSTYIILVESGNGTQTGQLQEFRQMEDDMRDFCQALPEDRNMVSKFYRGDMDLDEEEEDDADISAMSYRIESTGAAITLHSAVPLIHRYCGSLPSDSFCVLQPAFEIQLAGHGYNCVLRLPSNAAVREVISEVARTKTKAIRMAALEACKQLHKNGAFNDHLLPRNIKRELLGEMAPQLDENGQIIGSRRRKMEYEKRTPRFWEREEEAVEEEDVGVENDKELLKTVAPYPGQEGYQDERRLDENVPIPDMDRAEAVTAGNGNSTTAAVTNGAPPATESMGDLLSFDEDIDMSPVDKEEEEEEQLGPGPFNLYMSIFHLKLPDDKMHGVRVRRMGILTWKPFPAIPDFELYDHGRPFGISMQCFDEPITLEKTMMENLACFALRLVSAMTNKEFSCPIPDFPYFLVPLLTFHGDKAIEISGPDAILALVDWAGVIEALEPKPTPINLEKDVHKDMTDYIITDYADNMRRYYVQEVRHDMSPGTPIPTDVKLREEGFSDFAAYYKEVHKLEVTVENQPMIRVQRISKVMNYLMPVSAMEPQEKKRTATFVIPEFCSLYMFRASVFASAMILPSIMTRVDSYLLVREAAARYHLQTTDDTILEAYTTPSASMAMNYERLETLGDSLLKFLATIRLYTNFPFSNEGELHCLRIRVICNRALYRAAKRLKLFRFVTSHAFNRRHWRPHHFVAKTDTPDTLKDTKINRLSDKTLADIVEASMGAAYISSGLEGGLQCAIAMQIPFDEVRTWNDFILAHEANRTKIPPRAESSALRSLSMKRVEEITGYQFQKPLLVVEALTHASLPNSSVACYQRLEFLGDAILDFLVIRYLYDKYPDAPPGLITDIKDSCVNNHVLGIICVINELHTQIIHYSGAFIRAIEEFCKEHEGMKQRGEAVGEYWTDLTIPKVLSDVVESMLGAVFVDAGFQLEPVQRVFEKWMLPLYNTHVTPETLRIHPLRKFTTDLQRAGCDDFKLRNHITTSSAANSQRCVIFLHDQPLATGAADNIKAARRDAATKASLRLAEDPGLLERVCNCKILNRKRKTTDDSDEEDND